MTGLSERHCQVCEGGVAPLNAGQIQALLEEVSDWLVNEAGNAIHRSFTFKNFHHTMAFVNAVAWIAHQEDHHPDLAITYKACTVTYTTHAIEGLSENDFICAARIDDLLKNP